MGTDDTIRLMPPPSASTIYKTMLPYVTMTGKPPDEVTASVVTMMAQRKAIFIDDYIPKCVTPEGHPAPVVCLFVNQWGDEPHHQWSVAVVADVRHHRLSACFGVRAALRAVLAVAHLDVAKFSPENEGIAALTAVLLGKWRDTVDGFVVSMKKAGHHFDKPAGALAAMSRPDAVRVYEVVALPLVL